MPKKIEVLPESISQTIAAGEVIERPASVVKELMENSIDAGSSEIIIELKAGGLQLIRVVDNGEGMDQEDVPVAFKRYATSKIRKAEDLFAIHTLGFRGEALPSIAQVSQMILRTRTPHSISGTKAVYEGNDMISLSEIGCPIGTEVEVKNIFYNIPVKRKFLKSIRSELRYALNHFLRLSLSHPTISFKFIHDGRTLHEHLKTEFPLVRIEAIFGKEIYSHLKTIGFEDGEIGVSGFSSLPSFSKKNSEGLYFYVNQRFVKDRMIHKAVLDAYRHILPNQQFPVTNLFLTIPPSTVASGSGGRELLFQKEPQPSFWIQEYLSSSPPWTTEIGEGISIVREGGGLHWEAGKKGTYPVLGQIRGMYILCEDEENLIFIDQHAAHERILFERFKKEYETRSIIPEKLLIPILIELSVEESLILESAGESLAAIGFEIEPVGEKLFAIRSVPFFGDQKDPKEMIRGILDELSFLENTWRGEETIHTILVTLACHSAIRGNFILRKEEMDRLTEQLSPFPLSATCPHGRPIFFTLPLEELKKQFKRK
jgi:DNA mismatch repair protein MutL